MFFADTVGLREVAQRVREFHATHGEWWSPAPLVLELAAAGRRFDQSA
jgi:3-hydroxyacyl-CoA dehydrogenase